VADEPKRVADDPEKAAERKRAIEEARARWAARKAVEAAPTPTVGSDREEPTAAAKPRVEAVRPEHAAGEAGSVPPSQPTVASHNPGGAPVSAPGNPKLEAVGTISQAVEVRGDPAEDANLRKLLGGIGAYQNPLRGNVWQVDYRYWSEARKRLRSAGYEVEETDYMGRPLGEWDPIARGWTRAEIS
jgi:hypothetical protein